MGFVEDAVDTVSDVLMGKDKSAGSYQDALAQYANIQTPDIEKMRLALEEYQNTGEMTPELQQAINLGQTELSNISSDPRLKASQMQALEQLAGYASGNPNAADMAGFELARQNAAGEMQAKNNQVLQEMQQRGQAGSGAELLAKLKNNQSGADMLQKAQLEQAQAMQQAKMQALASQAGLASSIRNQDYSEASDLAKAKDAINAFNVQNQQNVGNANVAAKNAAQTANLQNRQTIANANTDLRNQQQQYNKGLEQQNFNNQITKAGGTSAIYQNQAQNQVQQQANRGALIGGLIQSGAKAAASGGAGG